jgi:hypothetical protein
MCYPIVADTIDDNTFIEQPVHDTNVYTTDAVSSDSEDIEKLITLGKKYLKEAKVQRQRAYQYYLKVKDNPDYKEKVSIRKHEYYINNKDLLREKERYRYQNNVEYHDRVRARARALYKEKTADIPKQKRGRKAKPRAEDNDEQSLPKPRRGRPPKMKPVDNVSTTDLVNSNI